MTIGIELSEIRNCVLQNKNINVRTLARSVALADSIWGVSSCSNASIAPSLPRLPSDIPFDRDRFFFAFFPFKEVLGFFETTLFCFVGTLILPTLSLP